MYAKIDFYTSVDDSVNLAVYIVENDVEAPQIINPNDIILNYKHQHVLKVAVNSDFGEKIAYQPSAGSSFKLSVPFEIPSTIDKSKMELIIAVFKMDKTYPVEVLNCAILK